MATAPPQSKSISPWRVRTIVVGLSVAWLAIALRLVQLQWVDGAMLSERANRQHSFVERIPARPGDIVDRDGRILATTITARSLFVAPAKIKDPRAFADRLADVVEVPRERLAEMIASRPDHEFLWIRRRISEDLADRIRALDLPKDTWGFREEYQRRYPMGRLAAHVLGLRNIDGEGHGGLEENFDSVLKGQDGERLLIRDARGRVIDVHDEASHPPHPGQTVVTTLDTVIQLDLERELDELDKSVKPHSSCAIVLEPETGELLAIASRPTFDPNEPVNVPERAWKNTALSAVYEPGSTFKPFVVAWAMQREVLGQDEQFDCERGAYRMGPRVLHDHHPYGVLSVTDILVKSSNIGMAKIGERLGNAGLHEAAVVFGFGRKTGIELSGELSGILRPLDKWTSYSTGSIPMGQEIAVTPLQLVTAQGALANDGRLIAPRIVRRTVPALTSPRDIADSRDPRDLVVTRTVDAEIARWIVQGPMLEVVRRGTGKKAQLAGYDVFGKTGTAQKWDPAIKAFSKDVHSASFICGAPAERPRVLVFVFVDEPTAGPSDYGGDVAAPSAARILKKALVHLRVPGEGSGETAGR